MEKKTSSPRAAGIEPATSFDHNEPLDSGALPLSHLRPPMTDWCTEVSVQHKLALKRVRVRLYL